MSQKSLFDFLGYSWMILIEKLKFIVTKLPALYMFAI